MALAPFGDRDPRAGYRNVSGNGQMYIQAVAGPDGFFTVSAAFTRPADTTAYAAGDRVADSTSAATVLEFTNVARSTGESVRIERIRMRKTGATLTNASFRVHLFRLEPTVNVNDNGVFNSSSTLALADIHGYVGTVDITMNYAAVIGARGVGAPSAGSGITCEAAGTSGHETSLWAVVEATAAYVPASGEIFTVTIEAARS
jgi:hypothetical protein